VLVAEDNEFYEHEGVDVEAMREAFERNWKRGRITHGGSTITQQLAKNLYLSPSRNPLRKLREYFIARSLEKNLTKKRILEIYLNVVELGERVYGAEAASRHYFGKSASALTPREAALLAGALPNPRVMNPGDPNKRLRARQRMILSRMRRWGYLFERQVLAEKKPQTETTATAIDTAATAPVTDTDLPPPPAETETIDTETAETTTTEPAPATDTVATDTSGTQ
jgi:monofunctional biosynthetic peptidoglycan transglycosylase